VPGIFKGKDMRLLMKLGKFSIFSPFEFSRSYPNATFAVKLKIICKTPKINTG
jgi:hypothetical protein